MGFVMKGFSQSANSYFGHWLAKYLANENATIQSQMLQQNAKLPERAMEREREREIPDALCMEYVPKITNIRYIPKIFQMQLTVLYAAHMGMILSWPFAFRNHQKEALETLGLSFKPLPPAKLWNNMEYHGISYCNQSYIPNLTLVN